MQSDVLDESAQTVDRAGAVAYPLDGARVGAGQQAKPAFLHAGGGKPRLDFLDLAIHWVLVHPASYSAGWLRVDNRSL